MRARAIGIGVEVSAVEVGEEEIESVPTRVRFLFFLLGGRGAFSFRAFLLVACSFPCFFTAFEVVSLISSLDYSSRLDIQAYPFGTLDMLILPSMSCTNYYYIKSLI